MPSYFLNMLVNSRRVFGEAMIGVVSAYGCSRAVNFKNSTQFGKIAQGLVVSYGKGGTGHIKRGVEAAMVLRWLGLGREVRGYFDRVQDKESTVKVSEALEDICKGCE